VAFPLTSEFALPPAALIDVDQMLTVELPEDDPGLVALVREAEDSELDGRMIAAGGGRKGKRAEYRCAACGYGIVVYGRPPGCPMCSEARWEHVEWRPFSRLLDDHRSQRRPQAPSLPTAEEPIRSLRLGRAGASLET
jgi:hypothetical protein